MGQNLIAGCLMIAANLAIQCVEVALLLHVVASLGKKHIRLTIVSSSLLLMMVLLVMLAGNLLQITLWATLFVRYGEFENFTAAFYHSAVNFTTLGYGDIVMSEKRRLLGALEAANGVLMFGLTTSVLYSVISSIARRSLERQFSPEAESPGSHSSITCRNPPARQCSRQESASASTEPSPYSG